MNDFTWIPNAFLASALIAIGGAWWRSFSRKLEEMEKTLKEISEKLPKLASADRVDALAAKVDLIDKSVTEVQTRCGIFHAEGGKA